MVKVPGTLDMNVEELLEGFSELEAFPQNVLLEFCSVSEIIDEAFRGAGRNLFMFSVWIKSPTRSQARVSPLCPFAPCCWELWGDLELHRLGLGETPWELRGGWD